MSSHRIFKIDSPHLRGEDVREFQRVLTSRYMAWDINTNIDDDGDYGVQTRDAAEQVCVGLGILHKSAMKHGVTPQLRDKMKDPSLRTDREKERAQMAAAKKFRAKLRERFKTAEGVGKFDGKDVAAWIIPSLRWAREHGWSGHVNSGFRTCERQKVVAAEFAAAKGTTVAALYPNGPCASNHVGTQHPRGAVDVSEPAELDRVLSDSPIRPRLVWGGPVINDQVHFSANGH